VKLPGQTWRQARPKANRPRTSNPSKLARFGKYSGKASVRVRSPPSLSHSAVGDCDDFIAAHVTRSRVPFLSNTNLTATSSVADTVASSGQPQGHVFALACELHYAPLRSLDSALTSRLFQEWTRHAHRFASIPRSPKSDELA